MIVSPDKDMKQIPGKLYNFEETFTITRKRSKWHLIQTMAGDQTDGYSGPWYWSQRAEALFKEKVTHGKQLLMPLKKKVILK